MCEICYPIIEKEEEGEEGETRSQIFNLLWRRPEIAVMLKEQREPKREQSEMEDGR